MYTALHSFLTFVYIRVAVIPLVQNAPYSFYIHTTYTVSLPHTRTTYFALSPHLRPSSHTVLIYSPHVSEPYTQRSVSLDLPLNG